MFDFHFVLNYQLIEFDQLIDVNQLIDFNKLFDFIKLIDFSKLIDFMQLIAAEFIIEKIVLNYQNNLLRISNTICKSSRRN